MSTFDGAGKGMPAFVPAPARIEESFGTLEFAGGGFADDATTRMLYDELDLQRATQAYLDFYPALSLFASSPGRFTTTVSGAVRTSGSLPTSLTRPRCI
jgi:hypothetical protein